MLTNWRPRSLTSACLLAITLLAQFSIPVHSQPPLQTEPLPAYRAGELVVGFNVSPATKIGVLAQALGKEIAATTVQTFANTAVFQLDSALNIHDLAAQVQAMDGVRFAEPNFFYTVPDSPAGQPAPANTAPLHATDGSLILAPVEELLSLRRSAPTYPADGFNNWGFAWSGASIVWTEKSASPAVCLIDSGVEINHPDLKGRVLNGFDFVNNDALPNDDYGHGTHSAGIIAANANNKLGLAGVSNGKVIAVKAVNAQGQATAEDIARSIRYCADHAQTRVILVNAVGPAAQVLYEALDYAIRTRGRLVIAPAGDDATSSPTLAYPAAWASSATPPVGGGTNSIADGLISVAATAQQNTVTVLDTLGSPFAIDLPACRAQSSNYGDWVELAAPGEAVYSTLPAANPFMLQYDSGLPSAYGTLSGSSTAAAHAAAAAARTWSLHPGRPYPLWTATQVENRLKQTGDALNHAGGLSGEASFCWPDSGPNTTCLNLARAMNRGGLFLKVHDAQTGLPLKDAVVNINTCLTLLTPCDQNGATKDNGKIIDATSAAVHLINIPVYEWDPAGNERSDATTHEKINLQYNLGVQRSGYTSGVQTYERAVILNAGEIITRPYFDLAVPPARGTHITLTWEGTPDFDLELWLPASVPHRITRLNPGSLWSFPQARYFRDGGSPSPEKGDALQLETITINNKPGTLLPFYLSPASPYAITVRVNQMNSDAFLDPAVQPTLRVWNNGSVIRMPNQTTRFWPVVASCASYDLWRAFDLGAALKQPGIITRDQCGPDQPGSPIWPYTLVD